MGESESRHRSPLLGNVPTSLGLALSLPGTPWGLQARGELDHPSIQAQDKNLQDKSLPLPSSCVTPWVQAPLAKNSNVLVQGGGGVYPQCCSKQGGGDEHPIDVEQAGLVGKSLGKGAEAYGEEPGPMSSPERQSRN